MQPHQSHYFNNDPQSQSHHFTEELSYKESEPNHSSISSITSNYNHQHHENYTHCHCTTVKSQTSYISSLVLAGKFLYTGSSNRKILIWNRDTLVSECNHKLIAGKGAIKSLVVSSDKLFSAHQDHKIRVWKIEENESKNFQKITHIATLPTISDRAFKFFKPKNQVQVRQHKKCTWVQHVDTVSALALSEDELHLYSVSWDRTLKIWRTTDFKCLESVTDAHDDAINTLALSSNGVIYTGSADKKIKAWKKLQGENKLSLVATLDKHNLGVNTIALSDDDTMLYSGSCDKTIVVWEKDSGENMVVIGALSGHNKSVLCLSLVADLVCSGSADKTIRIWRGVMRHYSCLAVLEGHLGPIKCLTATKIPNNSSHTTCSYLLYSGSLDCDIKMWQIFVPPL